MRAQISDRHAVVAVPPLPLGTDADADAAGDGGRRATRDLESLLASSLSLLSSVGRGGGGIGKVGVARGAGGARGVGSGAGRAAFGPSASSALGEKLLLELNVTS